MELHGENPFKFRSYYTAYNTLRKWGEDLNAMDEESLAQIPGVGKAIVGKLLELTQNGEIQTLNKYKALTPEGIQEMLFVKGIGPKKVDVIWNQMGVETVGELLYACEENRLLEFKGFGPKIQENLKESLKVFIDGKGSFYFAQLEAIANEALIEFETLFTDIQMAIVGKLARKMEIVQGIEILIGQFLELEDWEEISIFIDESETGEKYFKSIPIQVHECDPTEFGTEQIYLTTSEAFLEELGEIPIAEDEESVFEAMELPFIPAELRENPIWIDKARSQGIPELIKDDDVKGVIHNHSTYSDGLHSLREMAAHAHGLKYKYLVISDHSKSAFYANGLKEDRVYQQWNEIDKINETYGDSFKVFKGIESDILSNGSLDYEEEILAGFDVVIASIHSNLKMDLDKAMSRLIPAIENPHTKILGHLTGRLLLSRPAYPVDHRMIIDACAANKVAIELNANPHRLDMDWRWIEYAMAKGVYISINPDAHSKEGMDDIHYGVCVARKGGLVKEACLNYLGTRELEEWLKK